MISEQAKLSEAKQALLKRWAKGRSSGVSTIKTTGSSTGKLALSYAQQRLWFLDQVDPGNTIYNVPAVLRVTGPLDVGALGHALNTIVRRHDSLRTRFIAEDGEPYQVIEPTLEVLLPLLDIAHLSSDEQAVRIHDLVKEEVDHRFDLTTGPLVRASLIRLEDNSHIVTFTLHHIVCDGWSLNVLVREVTELYEARMKGCASRLAPLPIQYADFAKWQRQWLQGNELQSQLNFWRKSLDGVQPLELPTDRLRTSAQRFAGARYYFDLSPQVTQQLHVLSHKNQCTLFMTVITVFRILLMRYSGQTDFCIGTPVANRNRVETESLIGFFVNTLVLRTCLRDNECFQDLLQRVRESSISAFTHQDLPFEYLVQDISPERTTRHTPLFQVMFAMQNTPFQPLHAANLTFEHLPMKNFHSKFDFAVDMYETEGHLAGFFEYNVDLFDAETIQEMSERFKYLLASAAQHPDEQVCQLPWSLDAEQLTWSSKWNPEDRNSEKYPPIHRMFEESVCRDPGRVAVKVGRQSIDYDSLNARATRLSSELIARGVGPDVIVGVYADRSIDTVVALLAIWKAGGGYLPLDPAYPASRLVYMLSDSNPAYVLTQRGVSVPGFDVDRTLFLEDLAEHGSSHSRSGCEMTPVVPLDALAYIIYTSGSTGEPKGVMISHHSINKHVSAVCKNYEISSEDRILQFASMNFDPSIEQIMCALSTGATLVMRGPEEWSTDQLLDELRHNAVTVANIPAALWGTLPDTGIRLDSLEHLRLLIVGGEAIGGHIIERLGSHCTILNAYGPTETTITASVMRIESDGSDVPGSGAYLPIGRPIDSTRLYVLDSFMEPLPPGIPGELYIGGGSVARGYLNQPALTAEKFVPDPFSVESGRRLFRTGDLVKRLRDGNIEFVGRADQQVKIRGFRIELGEIESVLASVDGVREAVVVPREDVSGDKRLVSYLVADRANLLSEGVSPEARVENWSTVFDNTYERDREGETVDFNIVGWGSRYGGNIPAAHMREWLDTTIARLKAFEARRILEIGSGTGMILFALAEGCEEYTATDISASGRDYIKAHLPRLGSKADTVHLLDRAAHDIDDLDSGYDLVVVNSVAQYFPSLDYFIDVVKKAMQRLSPGGALFLGDLRNLALLPSFSASLALHGASDSSPLSSARFVAQQEAAFDSELVISPALFGVLQKRIPEVGHAKVWLRSGHFDNELNRYRYDAVLYRSVPESVTLDWLDWQVDSLNVDEVKQRLVQKPEVLAISGVPNDRVVREVLESRWLEEKNELLSVGDLRLEIDKQRLETPMLTEFESLARHYGYKLEASWIDGASDGSYRLIFSCDSIPFFEHAVPTDSPIDEFANSPEKASFLRNLGQFVHKELQKSLPDYMVPGRYIVLDALPLTPNGKVDRKALPAPTAKRGEADYVTPVTPLQHRLAGIWKQVLGLDRVGLHDNFFSLGGYSLLSIKLSHRIRQELDVSLTLASIFAAPTLVAMARLIDTKRSSSLIVPLNDSASKNHLFCIHPIGGQITFYRELAQALASQLSVVGVQSPEAAQKPGRSGSMTATVGVLAAAIRSLQPNGPYYLAGWSSGATFATEVASALEKEGCEIKYLGLIDCRPHEEEMTSDKAILTSVVTTVSALRRRAFTDAELKRVAERLSEHNLSIQDLLSPGHDSLAIDQLAQLTGDEFDSDMLGTIREQVAAVQHHFELIAKSADAKTKVLPCVYWARDTYGSLGDSLVDNISAVEVLDGDHYSIMSSPQVDNLAVLISEHIATDNPCTTASRKMPKEK